MKRVGAVFMEPDTDSVLKVWQRTRWGAELHATELGMVRRLEPLGLVPAVVETGSTPQLSWIRYRRLRPLTDWLVGRGVDERTAMGRRVMAQVQALHDAGVCHRDLQLENVVLGADDHPVFIDLELALEIDPAGRCYDLDGSDSGVLGPTLEGGIGVAGGNWWDAPWIRWDGQRVTPPMQLASAFGPSLLFR